MSNPVFKNDLAGEESEDENTELGTVNSHKEDDAGALQFTILHSLFTVL